MVVPHVTLSRLGWALGGTWHGWNHIRRAPEETKAGPASHFVALQPVPSGRRGTAKFRLPPASGQRPFQRSATRRRAPVGGYTCGVRLLLPSIATVRLPRPPSRWSKKEPPPGRKGETPGRPYHDVYCTWGTMLGGFRWCSIFRPRIDAPKPGPPFVSIESEKGEPGRRNHDSTATVRKSLGCYVQDAYIYELESDS